MKAIPNRDGGLTIIPESDAESFFLDRYEDGISRSMVWDNRKSLDATPVMTIFPKGYYDRLKDLEKE